MTRVAVVGGGAVGTVLADVSARAGHETTLCVRSPRAVPRLLTDGEEREPAVTLAWDLADPGPAEPADLVLITTKAYDLPSALAWRERLATDRTLTVVCQNGVDHLDRVREGGASGRVLPAIVGIIAEREDGVVHHRAGRRLTVPAGTDADELAAVLRPGGGEVVATDEFDRLVWLKFLGNLAAAPVATLTGQPLGVLRDAALHDLLRDVLAESVAVGAALGVALGPEDVDATIDALAGLDPEARASMERDRAAGRPLETDLLTGSLVRMADAAGVPVPWNRALLALLTHLVPVGRTR